MHVLPVAAAGAVVRVLRAAGVLPRRRLRGRRLPAGRLLLVVLIRRLVAVLLLVCRLRLLQPAVVGAAVQVLLVRLRLRSRRVLPVLLLWWRTLPSLLLAVMDRLLPGKTALVLLRLRLLGRRCTLLPGMLLSLSIC